MIITKGISIGKLIKWTGHHAVWLVLLMGGIAALYHFNIIEVNIPWLPVSVVGTAVAFYVGFKNSQSYERMWEARKIWGGIVNESRTWGMLVDGFVTNQFKENKVNQLEISEIKKRLIYRHIAWLYAHRSQLLVATPWEHISQSGHIGRTAKKYQEKFGIGLFDDEITRTELKQFLPENEYERLIANVNTATHIINEQSRELTKLECSIRYKVKTKELKNFHSLANMRI